MKAIAVFDYGGVDRASVVYHLAWMYAELDFRVVVVDLSPQARLTSLFLDYAQIQDLLSGGLPNATVYSALLPLLRDENAGVATTPHVIDIAPDLGLVAGDMLLSSAADKLAQAWQDCADGGGAGLDATVYIWRALRLAAEMRSANLVLMDIGGFDPVSRAALVAADQVVVNVEFSAYSLPGIRETGTALRLWRQDWQARRNRASSTTDLPEGAMKSVGYVPLPPPTHVHRPVDAYGEWLDRIPGEYGQYVEGNPTLHGRSVAMESDDRCLGRLRHFVTLRPLAEDARKPIFAMKPADGILGSNADVVRGCYDDFRALALEIARRCDVQLAG